MKVLITGTTGFIGGHLSSSLSNENEIWSMNRRTSGAPREVVQDLRQSFDHVGLPDQMDAVIHCAALAGDGLASAADYHATNVDGTSRLLDYAIRVGARQFILFSTGGVYSRSLEPLSEEAPISPEGIYLSSKWEAEKVCRDRSSDIVTTVLRPFFPYGPGETRRLIARLAERIRERKHVDLRHGNDGLKLNPVYIADLVECVRRLLESTGKGETFNIAGPEVVSLRELAINIGIAVGTKPSFRNIDDQPPHNWIANCDRLAAAVEYSPNTEIQQGLRQACS
jgi:UDP-glucose 4-epimerase